MRNCLLVQFCPLVHFWLVPSKDRNPCKIDSSCKIDPRAIMTLLAVLSPRAKVSLCNFIFVQFCAVVQFYLRAILSLCSFIAGNFGSVYFSPLVQFRPLVHFCRRAVLTRPDKKYIKSVYFTFIFVKTQNQLEYIQMKKKISIVETIFVPYKLQI